MSAVKDFTDIQVDGINTSDAPDFCDAFICSATAILCDGTMRDATDEELDELNNDSELVYDHVIKRIY